MIVKKSKKVSRRVRHDRVRAVVEGTAARPRLAVYRSNKHISAQIIDDEKQVTLVSASTFESGNKFANGSNIEAAQKVGEMVAKKALEVVKGGRRFRFAALVVVGDYNGHVGFGSGKAQEVPEAIKKAVEDAKKNIVTIPIVGTTIPHEITGIHGAGQVFLKPAPAGTGIIAGGPVRNVVELAGIQDIVSKSQGSSTPINIVRATFKGLEALRTIEDVAKLRGKDKSEIL